MKTIADTAKEMKTEGFKTRQLKPFSFGTVQECETMLLEAFKAVDSTRVPQLTNELKKVALWMSDTKGKGLLLTGTSGRGKTNLVMFILPLLFRYKLNKVAKPIDAKDITATNFKEYLNYWSYFVDDIGTEDIINDYGTVINPVDKIISMAELKFKLCVISTNLNSTDLTDKYDDRILDRLLRLCHVIKFEGESLR